MYVKPARPGLVVRHPVTGRDVPPDGQEIDETDLHFAAILNDGDLVAAKAPKAKAADDQA